MSSSALRIAIFGVLLGVSVCLPRATPSMPAEAAAAEEPAATPASLQQPRVEEITFQSGSFTLVGELRLPEGPGPYPVILLNQGSELGDRTTQVFTLPIMERMLQAGFATFSWDKPGVGESTGQLSDTRVLHERAQIVLDAIEVMQARPDIDPRWIGLEGSSQAGYVMSLVLSMSEDIAFMICESCPGLSGVDQSTYQSLALALCTGTAQAQADRRAALLAELDAARTYTTYSQYAHYREVIEDLFGTAASVPRGFGSEVVPEAAWHLNDPERETWWDPIQVIRHSTIPVLVLLGDMDWQMDPLQAEYAWRTALQDAGNPHSRVELFPGANHDLAAPATGCPDGDTQMFAAYVQSLGFESLETAMAAVQEHPELTSQFPFVPGYLDTIEAWLRELTS